MRRAAARWRYRTVVLSIGIASFFLALGAGIVWDGGTANAHSGSHSWTLYSSGDKWYQRYTDSNSYVTWMTLSYDRHYECTGCETTWAPKISAAISDWNNTSTTLWYGYYSSHNSALDVHITIRSLPYANWASMDEVYDESYQLCSAAHDCTAQQSRPNTWWYEFVIINDLRFDPVGNPNELQAVIAHELGHGLSFAHPFDQGSDGYCPSLGMAYGSIMDYDCIYAGAYQVYSQSDVCGVNHSFYDPNWGYSGCQ